MTKRRKAELMARGIPCWDIPGKDSGCPLEVQCKHDSPSSEVMAISWLRDHPSLWDRIKNAIGGEEVMMQYEGYIHENGTIQVKRMPFGESSIDQSSPFVKEYLGQVAAISFEEAERKFLTRTTFPPHDNDGQTA